MDILSLFHFTQLTEVHFCEDKIYYLSSQKLNLGQLTKREQYYMNLYLTRTANIVDMLEQRDKL